MSKNFLDGNISRRTFIRGSLTLVAAQTLGARAFAAGLEAPGQLRFDSGSSAFPDATNTGVPSGTTLTNSGAISTSSRGQIIENRNVSGSITVNHDNVIIRRCKIKSNSYQAILANGRYNTLIEDCEIDGGGPTGSSQGIGGGFGIIVRRCNIHHCSDSIVPESDGLYEDNYIWYPDASGSPHVDTFQVQGSQKQSNITIRHNSMSCKNNRPATQNAGIYFTAAFGNISNVLVENNLIDQGDAYYAIYAVNKPYSLTGLRFVNNYFKKGTNGTGNIYQTPSGYTTNIAEWTNNRVYGTDQVISLPSWVVRQ